MRKKYRTRRFMAMLLSLSLSTGEIGGSGFYALAAGEEEAVEESEAIEEAEAGEEAETVDEKVETADEAELSEEDAEYAGGETEPGEAHESEDGIQKEDEPDDEVIPESDPDGADLPVDAHTDTDASVACRVTGSTYITPDPENPGEEILTKCGGGSWAEAWAEYRPVDFGAGAKRFFATASGKGRITVMTEKDGRIGSVEINGEHRYEVNTGLSASPSGVQSLWLLFDRGLTDLISFRFE